MKFLRRLFLKYYSQEVIQLFINEDGIKTYLGIINFPSFLNPDLAKKRIAIITARNFDGKEIAKTKITLDSFGSAGIKITELFPELSAAFGTISIKLKVEKKVKKLLKDTTMHFYVFFNDDNGSVAIIHPQSKINDEGTVDWESNAIFDISNIQKLRFFQINPSKNPVQNSIEIIDKVTKSKIAEIPNNLGSLCVVKSEFYPSNTRSSAKEIFITNNVIYNSKPIVFLYFKDGTFTALHS